MEDRMGQQFGNYRLVRLLGRGGFAEVYLGQHVRLNMQAAIKVLRAQIAEDDVENFHREAEIIASLSHPHIIRVLDFDLVDGVPFLIMDYAPNDSIRHLYSRGTVLPLPTIISYVEQVASALQYAHRQKLIHRDVKPENMLLGRNHEILLSDFGIALIAQSSKSQAIQGVIGTINYMAPEQLQGKPRYASDQYSLGVVIYEWLCGSLPFSGSFTEVATQHIFTQPPPLSQKIPKSPIVEEVVMTALAKDPQNRFVNVEALATALKRAYEAPQVQYFTSPGLVSEQETFRLSGQSSPLSAGSSLPIQPLPSPTTPVPAQPLPSPTTPIPEAQPSGLITPFMNRSLQHSGPVNPSNQPPQSLTPAQSNASTEKAFSFPMQRFGNMKGIYAIIIVLVALLLLGGFTTFAVLADHNTSSSSPHSSPSPISTAKPDPVPTLTMTPTPKPTPKPTPTPTPTSIPIVGPTSTPESTPTPTPAPTHAPTPTPNPTPTPTPKPTPSPTPTPAPTPSPTPTPNPTPTPTSAPSPTPSPTPTSKTTPTSTPTSSPSPTGFKLDKSYVDIA
jgi:serine/threonine protein kinase